MAEDNATHDGTDDDQTSTTVAKTATANAKKRRVGSPTGTAIVTFAAGIGIGAVLVAMPRPVAPNELPGLTLDPAAVADALAKDQTLAASAPTGDSVDRWQALSAELASAEIEPRRGLRQLQTDTASALQAIQETEGDDAIDALRAADLEGLDDAVRGESPERFGAFRASLEAYGAVRGDELRAPDLVVRAIAKARWNLRQQLEPTAGFADVEKRAYWGWLALHASSAEPPRRLLALRQYREAGGVVSTEAEATLLYHSGRVLEAAEMFHTLHQEAPQLRWRNHALAAVAAATE